MITKEQALTLKPGQVIKQVKAFHKDLDKPNNWRINGKVKTWVTRPAEFKVPIKHGLYDYGYLDHTNNHLFDLED